VCNAWLISLNLLIVENGITLMKFQKLEDVMLNKRQMLKMV
jgi:hypothetical protein